jgi:pyruvate formate lyase activating enzyme
MFQVDFAYAILSLSRQANIHTALETSGYVSWENLEKIASVTDLFLFDFKHPDSELHQSYTGVSNRLILKNLARLIRLGAEIVVRVPLIPTYNDSPSTVKEIGHKVANLGARKISLLPFNPASAGKYSWLHRPFQLDNVKMQSDEYITKLEEMLRDEKLEVIPS